jgi:hypothetical protein
MNKNNLSLIAVFFSLFFAQASFAQLTPMSLQSACAQISGADISATVQTECNLLSQGNSFNTMAIGACSRLTDNAGNLSIYECLVAIRGKSYAPNEINYCNSLPDNASTMNCFHEYGSFAPAAAPAGIVAVSVSEITQMLNSSLGSLNNFQTDDAKAALSKAISTLVSAQQISCH